MLLSGLAVFLCENFFYVWVSVIGDLNGAYVWYTGNPLNPDGVFGYGWTNSYDMLGFFGVVMINYLIVGLIIEVAFNRRRY